LITNPKKLLTLVTQSNFDSLLIEQTDILLYHMKSIKLMTHVVIGYPSLVDTIELAKTMVAAGADMVELQIPFSDPLADGPTIMRACEKSLENGTKVKDALEVMRELSKLVSVPLLFMSYYNIIFRYGVEKFIKEAKKVGCYGLIVPDMPIDEEASEHFYAYCKKYNLHAIRVISPSSTIDRLQKNAEGASGFVYFTSRLGTTGASSALDPNLVKNLERVKKYFKIPVAVGFGISKKEHIKALEGNAGHNAAPGFADIAVVGSKIIDIIDSSVKEKKLRNVSRFIKELTQ
jgi:tryptophan synthase alpha subunit